MKSQNQLVLEFLESTLNAGQPAWLITLLSIWGSAPRPAGSLLAVAPQQHCGSLSGGCLEENLLTELRNHHYSSQQPTRISIGVSQEQARQYRLPCGGQMQLLIEPIQPHTPAHEAYQALVATLAQRHACSRSVALHDGSVVVTALRGQAPKAAIQESQNHITHHLGPTRRLLLVGANLVAEQLATLAHALDLEVWVCDPRPNAFEQWPIPFVQTSSAYPDDLIRSHFQGKDDMIITLAHDPRVDDMALMEALTGPAAYIGALGSRKTTAQRMQRLRELGLDDAALARLHAPVGLDIGSKTPIEIAIAIAAELIAFEHQRHPAQALHAVPPDERHDPLRTV